MDSTDTYILDRHRQHVRTAKFYLAASVVVATALVAAWLIIGLRFMFVLSFLVVGAALANLRDAKRRLAGAEMGVDLEEELAAY